MRTIFILSLSLAFSFEATVLSAADILVNVRRQTDSLIPVDEPVKEYALNEFFQNYPAPGPIATFVLRTAAQDGVRTINTNIQYDELGNESGYTRPRDLMTYQFHEELGDLTYDNIFVRSDDAPLSPVDFKSKSLSIAVQLLPESAPQSVANFMSRVNADNYVNAVFHRSLVEIPNQSSVAVIQSGGYRLYDGEKDYRGLPVLERTPSGVTVPLEYKEPNAPGTLSMARAEGPNTASAEFFFNITDNSRAYSQGFSFFDPFGYTVFGRLVQLEADLPKLAEINQIPTFDGSAIFNSTAFANMPLFVPYIGQFPTPENYAVIESISLSEGTPASGITFSYEFTDLAGLEGDRDSFEVSITEDNVLRLERKLIGRARIVVKAQPASGDAIELPFLLESYNLDFVRYFPAVAFRPFPESQTSWYFSGWFGWMLTEVAGGEGQTVDTYPWIWHAEHGWIYLAGQGGATVVFYNESLGWVHTTTSIYPNLYLFDYSGWYYYAKDTGNAALGDTRWFYDFANKVWVRANEIGGAD
jgi:cyclophilin family peptidyl-prolyl cis-trans isomerase